MTTDRLLNILVTVTCIEMMVAVWLDASLVELTRVGRQWRLVERALLANYVGASSSRSVCRSCSTLTPW